MNFRERTHFALLLSLNIQTQPVSGSMWQSVAGDHLVTTQCPLGDHLGTTQGQLGDNLGTTRWSRSFGGICVLSCNQTDCIEPSIVLLQRGGGRTAGIWWEHSYKQCHFSIIQNNTAANTFNIFVRHHQFNSSANRCVRSNLHILKCICIWDFSPQTTGSFLHWAPLKILKKWKTQVR